LLGDLVQGPVLGRVAGIPIEARAVRNFFGEFCHQARILRQYTLVRQDSPEAGLMPKAGRFLTGRVTESRVLVQLKNLWREEWVE
jgi:hypothetical protein